MRCQVQLRENSVRAMHVMYGSILKTLTEEQG